MATKYGPRKKHNAGTVRRSTNTTGGSRTRSTTTVKTGNFTRSRSVNRNGTVRQTTTHKSPAGFITRTVKTIGSSPSKPKKPKFIVPKLFKAPKLKPIKPMKMAKSGGSSKSSWSFFGGNSRPKKQKVEEEYEDDDSYQPMSFLGWIVLILLSPFILLLKFLLPIVGALLLYMWYFSLAVIAVIIFLAIFT